MFISALGSIIGGDSNRLRLKRVPSAVVVLIDGLGFSNLTEYAGHARNLIAALRNSGEKSFRCAFPSTTAVSLAGFATGVRPGEHGIIGYQVCDSLGSIKNMLNGWSSAEEAQSWRKVATISQMAVESGVMGHMVASGEYENTPLTKFLMPDSKFHSANSLSERFSQSKALAGSAGNLVYLYVAELDQAAHRFGVGSQQWLSVLEEIDSAFATLKGNFGIALTADHGVTNVPLENHIYLDQIDGWSDAISLAIGDPRALLCYGDIETAKQLLDDLNSICYIASWSELESAGWVGPANTDAKMPDFYLIAAGNAAFYDLRTAKLQSTKMIGQHGALSDTETRVPLILGGLFV